MKISCEIQQFVLALSNVDYIDRILRPPLIVHKLFESPERCSCGERGQRPSAGAMAILYHHVHGPLLARSITRRCKKCDSSISFGRVTQRNGFVDISLENHFFYQSSTATFFDERLLHQAAHWYFDGCVSLQMIVSQWNRTFISRISEINEYIAEEKLSIGYRKHIELNHQLFAEAFWGFFSLKTIKTYIRPEQQYLRVRGASISERINSINAIKTELRIGAAITHLSEKQLFELIIETEILPFIQTYISCEFSTVPVIQYNPFPGHNVLYGDGNRKLNRRRCSISPELYAVLRYKKLVDVPAIRVTTAEYITCSERPFDGNQNAKALPICINCAYGLSKLGIAVEDLGSFIDFRESHATVRNLVNRSRKNKGLTEKESNEFERASKRIYTLNLKYPQFDTKYKKIISALNEFEKRKNETKKNSGMINYFVQFVYT